MKLKYIIKAIEEDIVKHPVTERALRIGESSIDSPSYIKDGRMYYDRKYDDGTIITYEKISRSEWKTEMTPDTVTVEGLGEIVSKLEPDLPGFDDDVSMAIADQLGMDYNEFLLDYDELGDDFFQNIGDFPVEVPILRTESEKVSVDEEIIAKVTTPDGETCNLLGYEDTTFSDYPGTETSKLIGKAPTTLYSIINNFSQEEYWGNKRDVCDEIRNVNINGADPEEIYNRKVSAGESELYWDLALNKFGDIANNNHIPDDAPSFYSVQHLDELPEGQGTNKGIVQNNDFSVQYCSEGLIPTSRTAGNPEVTRIASRIKESEGQWTIITLQEQGNPARNGIPEVDKMGYTGGTFITGPNQKNERYIIDNKNKVIVQRPYKAGMERHIWG